MTKILANDGISKAGINALTEKGFSIVTNHVKQDQLIILLKLLRDLEKEII